MEKLANSEDLKSSALTGLRVRPPLPALRQEGKIIACKQELLGVPLPLLAFYFKYRTHNSVGQSSRLITEQSLVQVQLRALVLAIVINGGPLSQPCKAAKVVASHE